MLHHRSHGQCLRRNKEVFFLTAGVRTKVLEGETGAIRANEAPRGFNSTDGCGKQWLLLVLQGILFRLRKFIQQFESGRRLYRQSNPMIARATALLLSLCIALPMCWC